MLDISKDLGDLKKNRLIRCSRFKQCYYNVNIRVYDINSRVYTSEIWSSIV